LAPLSFYDSNWREIQYRVSLDWFVAFSGVPWQEKNITKSFGHFFVFGFDLLTHPQGVRRLVFFCGLVKTSENPRFPPIHPPAALPRG
jgi:hypothetical protein